jgi:hypothetical protein
LRNFLPIVLIALMVQILAPIGACWAVSIAASDPLHPAAICHGDAASNPGQTGQPGKADAHDGCCSVCNVLHSGAPVDVPGTTVAALYRQPVSVVWHDRGAGLFGSRAGSHAQARAPPSIS